MEYINGGNLCFHLDQRGYFDLASVRFYAAEIICGLQFLHSNGVIYRDLKLQNVMLDQDGHIKIVDFGISKENMLGDSRTKTFCGSPHYMAPELLQRDRDCRLGKSGNIRAHPFFKSINWAKIERREVKPPYKPKLKSPHDCRYFEKEFFNETPGLSQGGNGSGPIDQSEFVGFSFVNPNFTAHTEH